MSPRWRKLFADVAAEKGRIASMVVAIAVSLAAVGAVLGSYALLTREMAAGYAATLPAHATLEMEGGIDEALLARARGHVLVAAVEAREVVSARVRLGSAGWRPLLLFVVPDFRRMRVNRFHPARGAWPPPDGSVLVERSARTMLEASLGQPLLVEIPGRAPVPLAVSGVVHDPALAPAGQERGGYAYASPATVARLGQPLALHELRVLFREPVRDTAQAERNAADLAAWLASAGWPVHQIRVPPLGQHPHQRQMTTVLFLMLAFAVLALLLSAILVATTLAALMARQVREIGVMKTLGARTGQIAGLYLVLILAVGLAALGVALPAGTMGARGLSLAVAAMLNFDLASRALPWWVAAAQGVGGLAVPLLVAALPVARASRQTARDAMDQHGTGRARAARMPGRGGGATASWWWHAPHSLRNAFRRPTRLALTVGLLAAAGATFMSARNLSVSWDRNLAKVDHSRRYDLELRLDARGGDPGLADRLVGLPGVRAVEAWGYSPAAFTHPGKVDVVRAYPDRGHGSLSLLVLPAAPTNLVRFPVLRGRWLREDDGDAVVLNHAALAQLPGARLNDRIAVSFAGGGASWRLVGVVEEVGAPGAIYVAARAFAAATTSAGARPRLFRVALEDGREPAGGRLPRARPLDVARAAARLEDAVTKAGGVVEAVTPLSELKLAISGHIQIVVQTLLAMALVMAVVGMLGLASTMGTAVVERTREIGVMMAMGATRRRVVRIVVAEALFIAGLSWPVALATSIALTAALDHLVGNLGFLAPLPFAVAPLGAVGWLAAVCTTAAIVSLLPAADAASLSVREALARP